MNLVKFCELVRNKLRPCSASKHSHHYQQTSHIPCFQNLEPRLLLTGTVEGYVWEDLNNDQIIDPDEPRLGNWTVYADLNQNNQLDPGEPQAHSTPHDIPETTNINEKGAYRLSNIPAGEVTINIIQQTGWQIQSPAYTYHATDGHLTLTSQYHPYSPGFEDIEHLTRFYATDNEQFIYLPSEYDDTISVFTRDLDTGQLTNIQKLTDGNLLDRVTHLAISPDGEFVYAFKNRSNHIEIMDRDPATGMLSFLDRLEFNPYITAQDYVPLNTAISVDGQFIYLTGEGYNSPNYIAVFERDITTGSISVVQINTQYDAFHGNHDLIRNFKISADQRFLYALNHNNAILTYEINQTDGTVNLIDTLYDSSAQNISFNYPFDLVISPNDLDIYVTITSDNTIVHLQRDPQTGLLQYIKSYENETQNIESLNQIRRLKLDNRGNFLYVGTDRDQIVTFSRDAQTGELTYANTFESILPREFDDIALTQDHQHLYVIGDHAINVFQRSGSNTYLESIVDDNTNVNVNFSFQYDDDAYDITPNDNPSQAYSLTNHEGQPLSTIAGKATLYDPDWYYINIPDSASAIQIDLLLNNQPDLEFNLYNEIGQQNFDLQRQYGKLTLSGPVEPGDYYIEITGLTNGLEYDLLWQSGQASSISGTHFHDKNNNNIQDNDEPGLPGVMLYADYNYNGIQDTNEPFTLTREDDPLTPDVNEAGQYTLNDILPGNIPIVIEDPTPGWFYTNISKNELLGDTEIQFTFDLEDLNQSNIRPEGTKLRISPDGRFIYAGVNGDSKLHVFERNTYSNSLTLIQTLVDNQNGINGLATIDDLKLSSDGSHLYITSQDDISITLFTRNQETGLLSFHTRYRNNYRNIENMDVPGHIEISSDGRYLYVGSGTDHDTLTLFLRNLQTGQLQYIENISNADLAENTLQFVSAIVASPDNKYLYIGSRSNHVLSVFERNQNTGQLSLAHTYRNNIQMPIGLNNIGDIALTNNGRYLYATSINNDSVIAFERNPEDGSLEFLQVIEDPGNSNYGSLNGAFDLTLSPEERFLYVAARNDRSVLILERDPSTGHLTIQQHLKRKTSVVDGIYAPGHAVLSPDGNTIYIASYNSDTLGIYQRNSPYAQIINVPLSQSITDINFILESPDDAYDQPGNDTSDQAVDLTSIDGMHLSDLMGLATYYDQDWYQFTLHPNRPGVEIEILPTLPNADLNFTVYNANLQPVGNTSDIINLNLDPGQYYILVEGGYVAQEYDLRWQSADDDPYDTNNNDHLAQAYDLSAFDGIPLTDNLGPAKLYDQDWYKINISPESQGLEVYLDILAGSPETYIRIYDSNQNIIASTSDPQLSQYLYTPLPAGEYFIRISGNFSTQEYDLKWVSSTLPVVQGTKWNDLNSDGIHDHNEPGLPDFTIYADLNQNGLLDDNEPFTITQQDDPETPLINETGQYLLTGLPAGQLVISEVDKHDWHITYPELNLSAGNGSLNYVAYYGHSSTVPGANRFYATHISHDAQYLYAVTIGNDSLYVFERNNETGKLSLIQEFTDNVDGIDYLNEPKGITSSQDGRFIYVTTGDYAVNTFERNFTTGELTLIDTIVQGNDAPYGLRDANAILLSKDENHLYLISPRHDAITHFTRNPQTGTLTYVHAYTPDNNFNLPFENPVALTISEDNKYIYVAVGDNDTLMLLERDTQSGALTEIQSLSDTLNQPHSVELSPDQKHIYVANIQNDSISVFERDPSNGTMTFVQSVQHDVNGVTGLNGAWQTRILNDGLTLLAVSAYSNAITIFNRNPENGQLTFVNSLNANQNNFHGMDEPVNIELSPDNRFIYISSDDGSAITLLKRDAYHSHTISLSHNDIASSIDFGNKFKDDEYDRLYDNDSLVSAYPLPILAEGNLSSILGHAILADSDWFKLVITEQNQLLTLKTIMSDQTTILNIRLYDNTGYLLTPYNQSPINGNSYITPSPGTYYIEVSGSNELQTYDLEWAIQNSPIVQGTLWYDINANGVHDQNEPGIPNRIIYADLNLNGIFELNEPFTATLQDDPTTPDIDETGQYSLINLPEGKVAISTPMPELWHATSPEFFPLSLDGNLNYSNEFELQNRPDEMIIAPNGEYIYVSSYTNSSITVFSVDSQTGNLAEVQYIQDYDTWLMRDPRTMALSPDGNFLYAFGSHHEVVVVFQRDPESGLLTYLETYTEDIQALRALEFIDQVVMTNNGRKVYAVSGHYSSVTIFDRNPETGSITFDQYINNGSNGISKMKHATGISLSQDNRHLYVASPSEGAITIFDIDPGTHRLTINSVITDGIEVDSRLEGINRTILSPDGNHLYATSVDFHSIYMYQRDPSTGILTYLNTFKDDINTTGINRPDDMAISPDGRFLTVSSRRDDTMSIYRLYPQSSDLQHVTTIDNANKLYWPRTPGFSTDQRSIYVLNGYHDQILKYDFSQSRIHQLDISASELLTDINFTASFDDDYIDFIGNDSRNFAYDLSSHENTPISEIFSHAKQYDDDWYKITLDGQNPLLQINSQQTGGIGYYTLELYDNSGQIIPAQYQNHQWTNLAPGEYFIRISGNNTGLQYDLTWNTAQFASVSGHSWFDINADGIQNNDEPNLPGWTIYADLNHNNQLDPNEPSTITLHDDPSTTDINETGYYQLNNLPLGTHRIRQVPQSDWSPTFPNDNIADFNGQLQPVDHFLKSRQSEYKLVFTDDMKFAYMVDHSWDEIVQFQYDKNTGDLTHIKNFSESDLPGSKLKDLQSVKITSDGEYLVAVAYTDDSINLFKRDTITGEITFLHEISFQLPNTSIYFREPRDLFISPDDKHIYCNAGYIFVFEIDRINEQLVYIENHQAITGHTTLSPDGLALYHSYGYDEFIKVFRRNITTGQIQLIQTINHDVLDNSYEADLIVITPNGKFLYALDRDTTAIHLFTIDKLTRELSYVRTFKNQIAPSDTLQYITTIEVTPDGSHLLAINPQDTIATLEINQLTGNLTFKDSFSNGEPNMPALPNPRYLNFSPDGRFYFIYNTNNLSMTKFKITPGYSHEVNLQLNPHLQNINFGNQTLDDHYDYLANDIQANAFDLTPYENTSLSNIFGPGKLYDDDWYQFTIDEFSAVRIQSQLLENRLTTMHITDNLGNILHTRELSTNLQNIDLTLQPGNYGILVTGHPNAHQYDLKWTRAQLPLITGTHFKDINNNGFRDPNDTPLPGMTIYADLNNNGLFDPNEPSTITLDDDPNTPDINEAGYYELTVPLGQNNIAVAARMGYRTVFPDTTRIAGQGQLALIQSLQNTQNINNIAGTSDIHTSADGNFLYALAADDNALSVFQRNSQNGTLSLIQQLTNTQDDITDMISPNALTLSPDGKHLYVTAFEGDAIIIFERDANTGQLTYLQSMNNTVDQINNLDGPRAITFDSTGQHAYIAAFWSNSLSVYTRDSTTGQLTFLEEHNNQSPPLANLSGFRNLTLSPDGKQLYLAAFLSDAIAVFNRNEQTGQLTHTQNINNNTEGFSGLDGVSSLTFAADGRHLYTTGFNEDTLVILNRNTQTGHLTFNNLFRNNILGITGMDAPSDVKVTPDGHQLYVAGTFSNSVTHFQRNQTSGALTYISKIQNNSDNIEGLAGVQNLAISPDSNFIYTSAFSDNNISTYRRYHLPQVYQLNASFGSTTDNINFGSRQPADTNMDGNTNSADIDFITLFINSGLYFPSVDVNLDQQINKDDLYALIHDFHGTKIGDTNLDRTVNLVDLANLANNFSMSGKGWADGDFNLDGTVNLEDLALLADSFGYTAPDNTAGHAQSNTTPTSNDNQPVNLLNESNPSSKPQALTLTPNESNYPTTQPTTWQHIRSILDDDNDATTQLL